MRSCSSRSGALHSALLGPMHVWLSLQEVLLSHTERQLKAHLDPYVHRLGAGKLF